MLWVFCIFSCFFLLFVATHRIWMITKKKYYTLWQQLLSADSQAARRTVKSAAGQHWLRFPTYRQLSRHKWRRVHSTYKLYLTYMYACMYCCASHFFNNHTFTCIHTLSCIWVPVTVSFRPTHTRIHPTKLATPTALAQHFN